LYSDQLVKSLQQNSRLEYAADVQNRKLQDTEINPLKLKDTVKSEMVGLKETSPFDHSNLNSHSDNPDILPSPSQFRMNSGGSNNSNILLSPGSFMKDSRSDHLSMHPPSYQPNMRPRFNHPDSHVLNTPITLPLFDCLKRASTL